MPSITNLVWISVPLILAAIVYQLGFATIATALPEFLTLGILQGLIDETHCYASIKTLSSSQPQAECFTVSGGKFTKVYSDKTTAIDAVNGQTGHVIPGLWDGHGHLIQYGELLNSVNLFGAESMDEVQQRLVHYKNSRPELGTSQQWVRGVGWDQAKFDGRYPVASDLEIGDDFKDQYVMLDRVDIHCIWVSQKVLDLLPSPLPQVPGGEIPEKGVFCDNAMDIVMPYYPRPNKETKTKFIKDAMEELNKLGIVGMHDAGVLSADINLYEQLVNDEDWNVRVYAMLECGTRNTFCPDEARRFSTPNGKLHARSVKLFGDGALGSWGSAMIEPYRDKPESSGSLLVNASTLSDVTKDWATAGFQVNIHAIGDLANRNAIDAFLGTLNLLCPEISPRQCQKQNRFRIEHSQIIHPDDQIRMFEFGIIPSIQPTHATSDMPYAESRLGKKRTKEEAYLMRSLLKLNPVLGSDFPVEPANVFEGIYAAVTRRSPHTGLNSTGGTDGWYPAETLTLQQALIGFTANPAYASFLEGKAGVIQTGAYADWVVLDEPLDTTDVESLRKVTVKETWVAGKRVYKRPEAEDLPPHGSSESG
ncbi:hypothetical protein BU24DRAFT_434797 [Aaosphaeria arxii CBS 175.79]|uniref:Amidohydrolase 3 domain-containing protein n=1 Tax=Aaosphaeria arxii CBS 175.79 TaxID=1450172 RepID=A0A6A5XNJ0_9PLEO|nr:uncharacterized protein BU24DRAFT_434797 [Aaosphaeria arxii CBS 175.79]KAF2013924.1 hypothetical protein BU24DRAFT_434797 [Aaosphaeria arxii CBS 175.79]